MINELQLFQLSTAKVVLANVKNYLKLQLDPFIKVLLWKLKRNLEEKIEKHKENVKRHGRGWKEYETKIKSYDKTIDDYKSARRKLKTMLDKQKDSTSDQVTETCNAARIVLQVMNAFTTKVEEVKGRIYDKCREIKDYEEQIHQLEINIRNADENAPGRLRDFLKHMDKDLTTALSGWEQDKNALEPDIVKWENMVERERQIVAVECQGHVNEMRDRAKMKTTQLIFNGAGTLGAIGMGVAALGTPGESFAAGVHFLLAGYFGKRLEDQILSVIGSKDITSAAVNAVNAFIS